MFHQLIRATEVATHAAVVTWAMSSTACTASSADASLARGRETPIQQVATLGVSRSVHTATTLPSGDVLVVGGMADGGASLASVELFDATRLSVRPLGALQTARASHTATPLDSGRVLIAGGYDDGTYLASVEVFEPSTRSFHAGGPLTEPRSGHTATRLPDGRILIVGGVGPGWTFLRTAELYDPRTGQAVPVGSMRRPRESHTATLLGDGRVLVIGGHAGRRENMEVYASAELFDPRTGRFTDAGALATPRHKHDAVKLADGRVLVVGGADRTDDLHFATTEVWDPAATRFSSGPDMRHRRYKIAGTSVLLPSGDVLVIAGGPAAELLDTRAWRFRELAVAFPAAYRFAATALLHDGSVIATGGYAEGIRGSAGVWRYREGRGGTD